MKKDLQRIAILLFVGIAGVCFLISHESNKVQYIDSQGTSALIEEKSDVSSVSSEIKSQTAGENGSEREIYCVYVCGMVKREGVYRLYSGARVASAIKAAGGMLAGADSHAINLAEQVFDGMKLYVPSIEEGQMIADHNDKSENQNMITGNTGTGSGLININTADSEELQSIPGIGPSKAQLIIDYRTQSGYFSKPEDIMLIKGIKEGLFNKIKDRITT